MSEEDQVEVLWSWLHLSDVHFGHGDADYQEDQKTVLHYILQDIERNVKSGLGMPSPSSIVLTGDIAFSGGLINVEEYKNAASFVADVRAALGLIDAPVYAVAGNHDVRRTTQASRNEWRLISGLREGSAGESLDASLRDAGDLVLLKKRFSGFEEFCASVNVAHINGDDYSWHKRIVVGNQVAINLIGLNTAFLCNDNHDYKKLRIARSTLNKATFSIPDGEIAFALGHHPLSWLEESNGTLLMASLDAKIDVHFHGHLHEASTRSAVTGHGTSLVTVAAGAVHPDSEEAKAGIARTYNVGAIVQRRDGAIEIRVWPRKFVVSSNRWVLDAESVPDGQVYTRHVLRGPLTPVNVDIKIATAQTYIGELSAKLLDRVGRRRTAFPTDMSVKELYDGNLLIEPCFDIQPGRATVKSLHVGDIVASAADGRCLILGAPGSGKTVVAYQMAILFRRTSSLYPVFVDLSAVISDAPSFAELLVSNAVEKIDVASDLELVRDRVVFIVDGVDEALAAGMSSSNVASRLEAIASYGKAVVFCRAFDYESQLATHLADNIFDSVRYIRDWSWGQFASYVEGLVSGGHLDGDEILNRVSSSSALTELAKRPLRARMLTSLSDLDDLPSDPTSLYEAYLSRLAAVTDTQIRQLGGVVSVDSLLFWRSLAWRVFSSGVNADAIPAHLVEDLVGETGSEVDVASRCLDAVLDLALNGRACFLHFSFYEFLVAQYIGDAMVRLLPNDPSAVVELLVIDLPIEIRRHLVRTLLVNAVDLPKWPNYLSAVYYAAEPLDIVEKMTVRNMVAYLICRLGVASDPVLLNLLENESDPFARNSLLWALTRANNIDSLSRYLSELQEGGRLSTYNRGYLLYYYGDFKNVVHPPFIDDDPDRDWSHTRATLNQKYGMPEYRNVPVARVAIDLFTFCDLAQFRSEFLTSDELARATSMLAVLKSEGLGEVFTLLSAKVSGVTAG